MLTNDKNGTKEKVETTGNESKLEEEKSHPKSLIDDDYFTTISTYGQRLSEGKLIKNINEIINPEIPETFSYAVNNMKKKSFLDSVKTSILLIFFIQILN